MTDDMRGRIEGQEAGQRKAGADGGYAASRMTGGHWTMDNG